MIVDQNDFEDLLKRVSGAIENGGSDRVHYLDNFINKSSYLYFSDNDPYENQLFYQTHPDAHAYESIDLHDLYGTMLLIAQGKLPAREHNPENALPGQKFIDLGSMVEERQLVAVLNNSMEKADWYYDYSDDQSDWKRELNEIKGIITDLSKLSKTESGLHAGQLLWDLYVPKYSINKPDFLNSTSRENTESQWQQLPIDFGKEPGLIPEEENLNNSHRRGRH